MIEAPTKESWDRYIRDLIDRVTQALEKDLPPTNLPLSELKVNFKTGDITLSRG